MQSRVLEYEQWNIDEELAVSFAGIEFYLLRFSVLIRRCYSGGNGWGTRTAGAFWNIF